MTTASDLWLERISPFADQIGLPPDKVTGRLCKIVGDPNDEGVALLANPLDAPDEMIRELFTDVPAAKLNKAIRGLREAAKPAAAGEERAPANVVLPRPPDDESFLEALKVGGIAKVSATDVNAALRALLARNLGVYDVPERLLQAMEAHAESIDEPVDESFYATQRLVSERHYGEILSSLGVPGRFVSEARKKRLFDKLDGIWDVLMGFQQRLDAWLKSWTQKMSNPAALMTSMAAVFGGGASTPLNMMEHPDVGPIRDSAEGVVDAINRIFAGTGIPVARALAYDALRVKSMLEDPALVAAVGASSREEMLKKLGIGVTADYVRSERDLATYVLAILELPSVPERNEPGYLVALQQLGQTIPWDPLRGAAGEGVGDDGHQVF